MTVSQTLKTTEQLLAATEDNLADLFRAMATALPGGELEESAEFGRHHTFPTNPMFKGVWLTRLGADQVDAAVDDNIAWFQARRAPYAFWWTGPGTAPPDLGARLTARGFIDMAEQQKELAPGIVQTAAGAPIMVADLDAMNEAALTELPAGFTIDEVADATALLAFKQVFVETYAIPDWAGQAWVDATTRIGIGRTPWRIFVGRLDGRPVATSMVYNGGGVASIYAVASVAAVRGRGIGGAITLQPLLDARRDGYRQAVLFSTEMGVRAYERIGFRLTDGRINRYLWRNDAL